MADVHDPATRSRNMRAIKNKNTKPEMLIRKALHREGFRYNLHQKDLPGKPDLVFPKYHAVIQVHGCYWHAHGCHLSTIPDTDEAWWSSKFAATKERDSRNRTELLSLGWRICEIWECALRGKQRRTLPSVVSVIKNWLNSDSKYLEIAGEREDDGFSQGDI